MFSLFTSLAGVAVYAYLDIFDKYQIPEVRISLAVAILISLIHLGTSLVSHIAKYHKVSRDYVALAEKYKESTKELVEQNQRLIDKNKKALDSLEKLTKIQVEWLKLIASKKKQD